MLKKIWATIKKEQLLLVRDVFGFLILYIMPIVLVVVMALIQDVPFKDYQDVKIEMLLVDEDQGFLSKSMIEVLGGSQQFVIHKESESGDKWTTEQAFDLVNQGKYKAAIHIPKGISGRVANNVNTVINRLSAQMGIAASLPTQQYKDSLSVKIHFDPAIKITYKSSIKQALDNFLTQAETTAMMNRIHQFIARQDNDIESIAQAEEWQMKVIGLEENNPSISSFKNPLNISSVQHNVPAWTIFAMFFIAVPFAANMIQERENGSRVRIFFIPNAVAAGLIGKMLFYVFIGITQFYLMILVGKFLMPWIGLDSLTSGTHHISIFLTAVCIAFCAAGVGALAGTTFKTPTQSLNTIVIMIVVFAAIGGIWVPVEVMPPTLKVAAQMSPLNWGMEAVNNLYLRNIGLSGIYKHLLLLLSLGVISVLLAVKIDSRRNWGV